MTPVAISLYDLTGNMLRPWAEVGFHCFSVDIQNKNTSERVGAGVIHYVNADLRSAEAHANILALKPCFLTSFTPCDDLSAAGSRHFAKKAEANPNYEAEALALAMVAPTLADRLGIPYMVENPVGRLATIWRKPDYYFNPCDYGGYLPADDKHPSWPDYIPPRDAYNKKTCLWSGNWFVMPVKRPVPPVSADYPGWRMLGGKSQKTKNIRSATPRGFAIAVFQANARAAWDRAEKAA